MRASIAVVVTVVVGFLAASLFGNWLNWPDAGAVFAVATMGAFLLTDRNRRGE